MLSIISAPSQSAPLNRRISIRVPDNLLYKLLSQYLIVTVVLESPINTVVITFFYGCSYMKFFPNNLNHVISWNTNAISSIAIFLNSWKRLKRLPRLRMHGHYYFFYGSSYVNFFPNILNHVLSWNTNAISSIAIFLNSWKRWKRL